jgi:hypothetical protein
VLRHKRFRAATLSEVIPTVGVVADEVVVERLAQWRRRLDAAELALEVRRTARAAEHATLLREVLELSAVWHADPADAPTLDREALVIAELALLMGCSEGQAGGWLRTGQGLAELPGAMEALECGLLIVETAATVVRSLSVLEPPDRLVVWQRLQAVLVDDADKGTVRTPARLADRLRRWVLQADADAVERRRRAKAERRVEYRRREDGLVDLTVFGIEPAQARAALSRIARLSAPWPGDERTADQRRADAVVDLLLGRVGSCTGDQAPCGCVAGEGAPCGAELMVLLPIGAALGTTDEVAELVGCGPVDAEQTAMLLRAAPRLHPVWVDDDGVPVAMGVPVRIPRGDPAAAESALLRMAAADPPEQRFPRHPHDHRSSGGPPGAPAPPLSPLGNQAADTCRSADGPLGPAVTSLLGEPGAHPPDQPGAYRPSPRLRRFTAVRAPLCEWASCGQAAASCDSEHDLAWPHGPTCACNLGPLCRRHHRIKQALLALGGRKARGQRALVTWTSPTGRTAVGPTPHEPPGNRPARPARPIDPFEPLAAHEVEHELWLTGELPDDPTGPPVLLDPTGDPDLDHPDDPLRDRLLHGDTTWDLDLADATQWLDLSER